MYRSIAPHVSVSPYCLSRSGREKSMCMFIQLCKGIAQSLLKMPVSHRCEFQSDMHSFYWLPLTRIEQFCVLLIYIFAGLTTEIKRATD